MAIGFVEIAVVDFFSTLPDHSDINDLPGRLDGHHLQLAQAVLELGDGKSYVDRSTKIFKKSLKKNI